MNATPLPTKDQGPRTTDHPSSVAVLLRRTGCPLTTDLRPPTSGFSVSAFQCFSVSPSGFPLSLAREVGGLLNRAAFCFLLLNAVAAEPKFIDTSALLQPATNTLLATPRITSNAPPSAASPVLQTTTNLTPIAFTNSMDALDDKHRLAIGDKLSFRIIEDLEDPKEPLEPRPLFVTDSGDIEIPYLGRVPAGNKTCQQLARELKTALEKEYYYQATVILAVDFMTKSRGKVYLVGPVRMPGPQEIPSDEVLTLSKAILRAGGFGDYADKHKVRVTRKGGAAGGQDQVFGVDVGEILEKGKTESDLPLESGDLIYVPERLIRF
jgi:protein involved in polysaccharide export with SLBB domain